MGVARAPVAGSGWLPACRHKVPKPNFLSGMSLAGVRVGFHYASSVGGQARESRNTGDPQAPVPKSAEEGYLEKAGLGRLATVSRPICSARFTSSGFDDTALAVCSDVSERTSPETSPPSSMTILP